MPLPTLGTFKARSSISYLWKKKKQQQQQIKNVHGECCLSPGCYFEASYNSV